MSQAINQSWHVGKAAAVCSACGTSLEPGRACWAALCERLHGATPPPPPADSAPKEDKKKSKDSVAEAPSPYERVDFCEPCWAAGKRPGKSAEANDNGVREDLEMFSFWKTVVPIPQQKKKLLVDDSVLVDLFARMSERNDPTEERFRFVLALILMRKRLLKYDSTVHVGEGDAKKESWTMFLRGTEAPLQVINPHLTADQISDVSQQLSSVLAEEI